MSGPAQPGGVVPLLVLSVVGMLGPAATLFSPAFALVPLCRYLADGNRYLLHSLRQPGEHGGKASIPAPFSVARQI